jgi:D-alanyl-D-alanine carboxypeptidase (penicillin-binding protein 5/6)
MLFEAVADGRLSLDDRFTVSEKAWRMGGSKMFLRQGERVRVEDLIRGIVVLSGNDACVTVAEGLAGSEEAFAQRMTERARELGMTGSVFGNSTGWPEPTTRMSPRDLVFLARRLITEFPQFYGYFAETDFEWDGVAQRNRNPLLYSDVGADGLKTGRTEEAGFGLVGSAERDGRRIVFMIGGYESTAARRTEAERIVDWAFREFENRVLYRAGQVVGAAQVWIGRSRTLPLTLAEDVLATVPLASRDRISATVSHEGPVEAPIAAGQHVGVLRVEAPDMDPIELPVVAAETVERGGVLTRLSAAARLLANDYLGAGDAGLSPTVTEPAPAPAVDDG